METLLIAVQLITVHMIDGREVAINPTEITRMFRSVGTNKQIPDNVQCVVYFTDGSFLSIAETCDELRALIGKEK